MEVGSKVELCDGKYVAGSEVKAGKAECQVYETCKICRPAMGRFYEQGTAATRPAMHHRPDRLGVMTQGR